MKIKVWLHGCDDSTGIPIEVSEEELKFLQKLSKLSYEISTYGCMPTLDIAEEFSN